MCADFYASTLSAPPGGHKQCWGSWYDPERKCWGFGCCRLTDKAAPCPLAGSGAAGRRSLESSSDSEADEEDAAGGYEVPSDFSAARCREDFPNADAYISFTLQYLLHIWNQGLGGGEMGSVSLPPECSFLADANALKVANLHLAPLLQQLKASARSGKTREAAAEIRCKCRSDRQCSCGAANASREVVGEVSNSVVGKLEQMCGCVQDKDYRQAEEIYYELSIGNAPWPIGGVHLGYTQKRQRKVYVNHSSMDNEEVKNYLQAIKRLVVVGEFFHPNADFSKNVHNLRAPGK